MRAPLGRGAHGYPGTVIRRRPPSPAHRAPSEAAWTAPRASAPAHLADSLPARRGWPLGFAHRGADTGRENTLAAFQAAWDAGFTYLELDVHTTADGVLVVFHDDALDRVTTGTGPLSALTWEELGEVRVVAEGAGVVADGAGESLLPLAELLVALPEARFNADLKDDAAAPAMAALLAEHDAWDRVLVASFHDGRRRAFRRALTDLGHGDRTSGARRVATSGAIAAVAALVLLGPLGLTGWLRRHALAVDCVQVPVRHGRIPVVTPGFVRRCHAAGLPVHVWVVDDAAEMERLLDMGADGIMTDRADVLAEVFTRRGIWSQH